MEDNVELRAHALRLKCQQVFNESELRSIMQTVEENDNVLGGITTPGSWTQVLSTVLPPTWKVNVFVACFLKVDEKSNAMAFRQGLTEDVERCDFGAKLLCERWNELLYSSVGDDLFREFARIPPEQSHTVPILNNATFATPRPVLPSSPVLIGKDAHVRTAINGARTLHEAIQGSIQAVGNLQNNENGIRALVRQPEDPPAPPHSGPRSALGGNDPAIRNIRSSPIKPDFSDIQLPLKIFISDQSIVPSPLWYFHLPIYQDPKSGRVVTYGEAVQDRLVFCTDSQCWYYLPQGIESTCKPIPVQTTRFTATIAAGNFRIKVFQDSLFNDAECTQQMIRLQNPERTLAVSGLIGSGDRDSILSEKEYLEAKFQVVKKKLERVVKRQQTWNQKHGIAQPTETTTGETRWIRPEVARGTSFDRCVAALQSDIIITEASQQSDTGSSQASESLRNSDDENDLPEDAEQANRPGRPKKSSKPRFPKLSLERIYSFETLWNISPYHRRVRTVRAFDDSLPLWKHLKVSSGAWNIKAGDDVLTIFSGYEHRINDQRMKYLFSDHNLIKDVNWVLKLLRETWCRGVQSVYWWLMGYLTSNYLYPGVRIGKMPVVCGIPGAARKSSQGLLHFMLVPGSQISEVFGSLRRAGFGDSTFGSPTEFLKMFFIDEFSRANISTAAFKHAVTSDKIAREVKFGPVVVVTENSNGAGASNNIPKVDLDDRRVVVLFATMAIIFNDHRFLLLLKNQDFLDCLLAFESGASGIENHLRYLDKENQWLQADPIQREGIGFKWNDLVLACANKPEYAKLKKNCIADESQMADSNAKLTGVLNTNSIRVHPITEGQLYSVCLYDRENLTMHGLTHAVALTLDLDTTRQRHQLDVSFLPSVIHGLSDKAKRMRVGVSQHEKNIFYFTLNHLGARGKSTFQLPWPASDSDYVAVRNGLDDSRKWPAERVKNLEGIYLYPIPIDGLVQWLDTLVHDRKQRLEGFEKAKKDWDHKRDIDSIKRDLRSFFRSLDVPYDIGYHNLCPKDLVTTRDAQGHVIHVADNGYLYNYVTETTPGIPANEFPDLIGAHNLTPLCLWLPCMKRFYVSCMYWLGITSQDSVVCPMTSMFDYD